MGLEMQYIENNGVADFGILLYWLYSKPGFE